MAGAFSFFQQPEQQSMVAPGLPAAALSGNPAATATNLVAINSTRAGAALGGALASLTGLPTIDPVQVAQARQQQYMRDMELGMAEGLTRGESMIRAAKGGYLTPEEQLGALDSGLTQQKAEREVLLDQVDFVRKSDSFKDYTKSRANFKEMKNIAQRGTRGNQSANDYALIMMGLKVFDPDSAVLQGELQMGKNVAAGRQALRLAGVSVNQIVNYAAGKGKAIELTPEQKAKWMKAVAGAVDGKRNALEETYAAGRDAYVAMGGIEQRFADALGSVYEQMEKNAYSEAEALDNEGRIAPGNGYNTTAEAIKAFGEHAPEVYGGIIRGLGEAGKDVLWDLILGGDDEEKKGAKPDGAAPRMGRGAGGRSLFKNSASPPTGRVIAPQWFNAALTAAYQTDSPILAMTMDTLDGGTVSELLNATARASFVYNKKGKGRKARLT